MRPEGKRGRFITLEGGEGAGKSTQARLLAQALAGRGIPITLTREPGGTAGAEAIRALLLDPAQEWTPRVDAMLFAAARGDHVAMLIEPALADGEWVVCDRYVDSSRAYQAGHGSGFGDLTDGDVMALHTTGSRGLMPDITFLLEAESEAVQARLLARDGNDSDRIGGRDATYHARVAERFRELAAAEPYRIVRVDASGSVEEVHARIMQAMAIHLGEGG